jgi:hypothetical protein
MSDAPALPTSLTRLLCIVILAVMLAALVYACWTGIVNYPRIQV